MSAPRPADSVPTSVPVQYGSPPSDQDVVLLTGDPVLHETVLRLGAAAGASVRVETDPNGALRVWSWGRAILVGADLAAGVAASAPLRREDVLLLRRGTAEAADYREAVALGAQSVLELPEGTSFLAEWLADLAGERSRRGVLVGVVGGAGGVGASTFAAALAQTSARARTTMLADLDPAGPGLPRILGDLDSAGIGWEDLTGSFGRLSSRGLRESLPRQGDLRVLAGAPPDGPVVHEVLAAARRGHDRVVLDLPRPRGASLVRWAPGDLLVVLVRPTVAGVASALATTTALAALEVDRTLVVRGRTDPRLADDVAALLGMPLAAHLPDQPRLDQHVDLGLGPCRPRRSSLRRAASEVLALLESESRDRLLVERPGRSAAAGEPRP